MLADSEQVLATGPLRYFEKQGRPSQSIREENGQATLAVKRTESGRRRTVYGVLGHACSGVLTNNGKK